MTGALDVADARTALLERTVAAVPPGSDAETVVENVLAACRPSRCATTWRCSPSG
jgi:hypothetical protein